MLALGLAAREAIAKTTGLAPDLRWPNDVLCMRSGRKCAGILAQLEGGAVIAGIGINVGQTEFPTDLEATSLLLAGATITREDVLVALVEAVDRYCAETPEEILRSCSRRPPVTPAAAECGSNKAASRASPQGLDPSGFLIVRQDNGRARDDSRGRRAPMLLALDVGNTNVTIGAFDRSKKLAGRWRLRTIREQTADEWGILIRNLFSLSSLDLADGRRRDHFERRAGGRSAARSHGGALLQSQAACSSTT